jgi:hypothetical protein
VALDVLQLGAERLVAAQLLVGVVGPACTPARECRATIIRPMPVTEIPLQLCSFHLRF